ncbi:hypothetical protein UUU_19630 [Klebsiella pneumoniae subsp. pneumoniae DSM 30104 = JCM 1662 = NBRC 14940]|nr:hypothetical protein UUU_19630 [Klebsiella pneumoniae subsp. pneumoniae DSM 30104 = JCM 1662 = NBRC 14940]
MKLLRHPQTLRAEAGRQWRFQPLLRQTVEGAVLNALLNEGIHFRLQRRFVLFQTDKARRVLQHKARDRRFVGVLPGDSRHHQVSGGDILHLTGQVSRQRSVIVLVALNLRRLRRHAGQHHIFHRPTGHADAFAAQRGRVLQLRPFRAKHPEEERGVGAAEVDHLLALGVLAEAGDHQVYLIGLQIRHAVGAGHRDQLQLELHRFRQIARHIDVIPLRLQVGTHRAERWKVLGYGNADDAAFFNILELVSLRGRNRR